MKVIKFAPGLIPVLKHGEHDQKTHGSWANGAISNVQSTPIPNDKLWSGVVRGETITADITVESKTFKLSQTNEKYDDGVVTMNLTVKNSDGKVIARMGTSNQFIRNQEYAKITGIEVATQYQRQGIATTMLTFARKHSVDGIKIEHDKNRLSAEGRAWSEVVKHGEHDQKTHGNWARGGGGNGLGHRAVYNLQYGMPDPLKSPVYAAEAKHNGHSMRYNSVEKPFPPNNRDEYSTPEEYDKAYKEYSKKFDEWAKADAKRIESDLGKELLDGTKAGVQRYVNRITDSDWFTEAFGDGGIIGTPKVTLSSSNRIMGQYTIGLKNGVGISGLAIQKYHTQDEVTILHELAHYATTINETNRFSSHGQEFARNHLYILDHAISPAYADGLEKRYREAGIPLGN